MENLGHSYSYVIMFAANRRPQKFGPSLNGALFTTPALRPPLVLLKGGGLAGISLCRLDVHANTATDLLCSSAEVSAHARCGNADLLRNSCHQEDNVGLLSRDGSSVSTISGGNASEPGELEDTFSWSRRQLEDPAELADAPTSVAGPALSSGRLKPGKQYLSLDCLW